MVAKCARALRAGRSADVDEAEAQARALKVAEQLVAGQPACWGLHAKVCPPGSRETAAHPRYPAL